MALTLDYVESLDTPDAGPSEIIGTSGDDNLFAPLGHYTLSGLDGDDILRSSLTSYADPRWYEQTVIMEPFEAVVYRLYDTAFDRTPDATGFSNWTFQLAGNQYAPGKSLTQVAEKFLDSEEFFNRYGDTTNSEFATLLYQNVLDREPDEAGLADWVGRLDSNNMSRTDVMLGFSESQEHINSTFGEHLSVSRTAGEIGRIESVFRHYTGLLDRPINEKAVENVVSGTWWDVSSTFNGTLYLLDSYEFHQRLLNSGYLDESSSSFRPKYPATEWFLDFLYAEVLERNPDQSEIDSWMQSIQDRNLTMSQVAAAFLESEEYIAKTHLDFVVHLQRMGGDTLEGGAGHNWLQGGPTSDTFIFNSADEGTHEIISAQQADYLKFDAFGYTDEDSVVGLFAQEGDDAVLRDQGTVVRLHDFNVADIEAWMIEI